VKRALTEHSDHSNEDEDNRPIGAKLAGSFVEDFRVVSLGDERVQG
jgi:hypothetical protein